MGGTTLTVTTGTGALFPVAPFNCTVWPPSVQPIAANAEIVRVTVVTGDSLTITRAQESTTAINIIVGYQIANTATAKVFTDIENAAPGGGNVTGPASATSGNVATYADATGKVIADGGTLGTAAFQAAGAFAPATGIANSALANASITIAGTATALGGSITQDTITGLASTGLVKRTATNTLAIAGSGSDYAPASGNPNSVLTNSTITIAGTATALGGSIALDTITGVTSNGLITRTAANTLGYLSTGTYAPASGIANAALANSTITIAGTSTALGGAITLDTISGVSTNGIIQRTAANTFSMSNVLPSTATATTAAAGTNNTLVATTAYSDNASRATHIGTFASPDANSQTVAFSTAVCEIFTNGAATRTYTLGAAANYVGQGVILYVAVGTGHVNFQPPSAAQFVLNGALLTANHYIQCANSAAGNFMNMISDGTNWTSLGYSGTWADAASA